MSSYFREKLRPIILTMVAPVAGFTFLFFIETLMGVEYSKLLSSIVNLVIVSIIAFIIFPKRLGIPFGRVDTRDFLRRVGLSFPKGYWKYILLGIILAGCNLSGILLASLLTGRYVADFTRLNVSQFVFCLNPALWEELFFRGVLMTLLLRNGFDVKRASSVQLLLFGVMHFKGVSFLALFDIFSVVVVSIGFTYVAYRTGSLLAGIVFHYFYDVFVVFFQVPGGFINANLLENAVLYVCLWSMVGLGCIITKVFTEKMSLTENPRELYIITPIPPLKQAL